MKYIEFEKDERGLKVTFTHYMPFDQKHGLGKSEQELRQTGALVGNIPEPEQIEGKIPVLYYNADTNSVYYEYEDKPLTEQDRIAQLERALLEMTALFTGGNA